MAATTLDRNTRKMGPIRQRRPIPLAVGSVIPQGVMVSVATPSAGAVNSSDTANHVVMGLSAHAANQTLGDTSIVLEQGIFLMANDGSITSAHIGQPCYVVDNQTVGLAAGPTNDVIAGYIEGVESGGGETGGVWVNMTQAKISAS